MYDARLPFARKACARHQEDAAGASSFFFCAACADVSSSSMDNEGEKHRIHPIIQTVA